MHQLGIFAKYWAPGAVKTRLAESLGADAAADLYLDFLRTTLIRAVKTPYRHQLAYTPAGRGQEFQLLAGEDWDLVPQAAGDLGARMKSYFEEALAAGDGRVVLIGSDTPNLPLVYLSQAFDALAEVPVVLGPSSDGGYYLVGAADRVPDVFAEIEFGGAMVWSETTARLQATRTRYHELPPWYDVDDLAGLRRLFADLGTAGSAEPELRHLLRVVEAALNRYA